MTVLTAAAEERARSLGATVRRVTHSRARLDAAMAALRTAPPGLSWGVDVTRNAISVSVPRGREAASRGFLRQARATGVPVVVDRVDSAPGLMAYNGGERLTRTDGRFCTAGFTVRRNSDRALFVLSAGHCFAGDGSGAWYGDGVRIGAAGTFSFPGNDFGILASLTRRCSTPAAPSSTTDGPGTSPDTPGRWSGRAPA